MPKMKTHRGAAKRFKKTGSGKLKRGRAFKNHMLEHKSSKRKRGLNEDRTVAKADERAVKRMLGI